MEHTMDVVRSITDEGDDDSLKSAIADGDGESARGQPNKGKEILRYIIAVEVLLTTNDTVEKQW